MSTLYLILQVALLWWRCDGQVLSALQKIGMSPDDIKGPELFSDLTMDKIITQAMGGIDVSAQKMISSDGMFLAELDMLLTEEQFRHMYQPPEYGDLKRMPYFEPKKRKRRKATRRVSLRWDNREIPYVFASGHFSDKEKYLIKVAMREWEKYTCLRFRLAREDDYNYVRFQNGSGCNSQLGMVGGMQVLNLDVHGCRWKGLYLHEIGHAIGLVHEHQLPNRDDYIDIIYENVAPSMRIWFNKYSELEVNQFDVDYEYSSVMHYGITAFSKNGKLQTIKAKDPMKEETIGKVWRKELAFSDVKAVNRMYKCSAHCPKNIRCGGGGVLDQNCKCLCPDGTENCQIDKPKKFDSTCTNEYESWNCYVWATQGECELNTKFMHRYCRQACKLCTDSNEGKQEGNHVATWAWQWLGLFANLFPRNWSVGQCQDKYNEDKCFSWKLNGDCITNERWMEENCKKTCGACKQNNTQNRNCANAHPNNTECDTWARKGECQINKVWMYKNCRSSCRLCGDVISDEPTRRKDTTDTGRRRDDRRKNNDDDGGTCSDKHNSRECQKWASQQECMNNPNWMIPNCRKSCNRCKDGSCKNLYDDNKCRLWARDHECAKNPDWMLKNCAKSCNTCFMLEDNDEADDDIDDDDGDDDIARRVDDEDDVNDRGNDGGTCQNDHNDADCEDWAQSGHCDINPGYMKVNCKRSCGVCTVTREDDGNIDPDKEIGDGTNNDDEVINNDDEVINKDDEVINKDEHDGRDDAAHDDTDDVDTWDDADHDGTSAPIECIDEHEHCSQWAEAGYCTTNAAYSLRACKKSCQVCKTEIYECRDEHVFCPTWATGNQCNNNPGYMLRFCQKSCKLCN